MQRGQLFLKGKGDKRVSKGGAEELPHSVFPDKGNQLLGVRRD